MQGAQSHSVHCAQGSARKPDWELGAKALLKKPRAADEQQQQQAQKWTVTDGDDDLIDDDALLTEEDRQRPAVPGEACPHA